MEKEKTVLQILIEQMYSVYNWEHTSFQERAGIATCIGKAKKLLDKEKENIIEAYDNGAIEWSDAVIDRDNTKEFSEKYFNNKFFK